MLKKILWATTACMVLSLTPCPAFCADNGATAITTSSAVVTGEGGINADMLKKFSAAKPYEGKINAVSAQNLNDLSDSLKFSFWLIFTCSCSKMILTGLIL